MILWTLLRITGNKGRYGIIPTYNAWEQVHIILDCVCPGGLAFWRFGMLECPDTDGWIWEED